MQRAPEEKSAEEREEERSAKRRNHFAENRLQCAEGTPAKEENEAALLSDRFFLEEEEEHKNGEAEKKRSHGTHSRKRESCLITPHGKNADIKSRKQPRTENHRENEDGKRRAAN